MRKRSRFFGIYAEPKGAANRLTPVMPFIVLILGYLLVSDFRTRVNPDDKIFPPVSKAVASMYEMITPDTRTGTRLFVEDTVASIRRIGIGLSLASITGLLMGLNLGLFPGMKKSLFGFVTFVSIIPPLAILPILFVSFG